MIKKRSRLLSGLLAIIMVAGMFTFFPLTTEVSAAGTVVTWSGNSLDSASSMYDKEVQRRTGACTVSNMTVNYKGGKENADSGFYNDISTSVITKVIYLNNPDSELIFTSSYNNRYITKIEIEFNKYYSRGGGTSDTTNDHIVVNHGAWTNEDV